MRMIRLNADYLERVLSGETVLNSLGLHPSGLVLGSFDGLHRGHQELVAALRAAKDRLNLRASALLTFRRHPRQLLDQRDSSRRARAGARWVLEVRVQLPDAGMAGTPAKAGRQVNLSPQQLEGPNP